MKPESYIVASMLAHVCVCVCVRQTHHLAAAPKPPKTACRPPSRLEPSATSPEAGDHSSSAVSAAYTDAMISASGEQNKVDSFGRTMVVRRPVYFAHRLDQLGLLRAMYMLAGCGDGQLRRPWPEKKKKEKSPAICCRAG
ncbi:hypothetical protein MN608_01159 [Microdochium nivale]|nr:hypothetical protein MN608_01159 [Microdochium nivale]